ncbi:hypothetical protein EDB19DRAFT_665913 [Suillus lakei]|nr:hypothetical protein EDB19DRAFT_665913 [Suillus lakei]
MIMRRRDRRSPTLRLPTQYSSTTGPTASKLIDFRQFLLVVSSVGNQCSVAAGLSIKIESLKRNETLETKVSLISYIGKTVMQLLDSNECSMTKTQQTLARCEPSVQGRATHTDIVTPRGTCGNTAPDDYVRDFLSSLRPNLAGKIQEFKIIGLDSRNTLDAFIQWRASEREGWIFSQNVYLQLTPLELGGLMLGIERLSEGCNGA